MSRPLAEPALRLHEFAVAAWATSRHRVHDRWRARAVDDRGEGVVSAAIVVLIMAALGALMWVGFRAMWTDIEADTNDRISEVGS